MENMVKGLCEDRSELRRRATPYHKGKTEEEEEGLTE